MRRQHQLYPRTNRLPGLTEADRWPPGLRCSLIVLGVFLASFTRSAERNGSSDAQMLGLWPAPPGEPRVRFVQSIAGPADLGIKPSGWSRLAGLLTGADRRKEKLVKPFGVAFDEADNLCLTDTATGWVWFFDRARKSCQHWESAGRFRFVAPVAVAKRKGVFYVADSGAPGVVAFDGRGRLLFEIASALERPSGLAILEERLFVADASAHCVRVYDLKGQFLSKFGQRGAAPGEFNYPTHLAVSADRRLFVTDSMNCRIQVLDAAGRPLSVIGSPGDASGQFSRPKGVAVDHFGHVYVVDALFDNFQIFDQNGEFLLDVGSAGSGIGEFWLPGGITIDRSNQVFVADSYNKRVQVFKYVGGR